MGQPGKQGADDGDNSLIGYSLQVLQYKELPSGGVITLRVLLHSGITGAGV